MDLITWFRGFFKEAVAPEEPPLEQTEYLRVLLGKLERHDASKTIMTREMPSRFPDIYHLIAMVSDARQNIKARASLPTGVKGSSGPTKTIADYLTDYEGRAAERVRCFIRLSEETAKLLDGLERMKKINDIEHRYYLMGLEVLLLEVGLVIETYINAE